MEMVFLLKGLIIGFSIAAPVGPIGLLCIQRTLEGGRILGFATGLGAATADAVYGSIASFGLTSLAGFLVSGREWLGLVGGLFLCCLGVRTLVSRPAEKAASGGAKGLAGAYASTFLLTLANPMTILAFAAVFAGSGIATAKGDHVAAGLMVAGVFAGSALWWLLLSSGVGVLRENVGVRELVWVNRLSGSIILAFGLAALYKVLSAGR